MSARDIVDADGHVTETTESLAAFIDPAFREYGPGGGSRSYYPSDAEREQEPSESSVGPDLPRAAVPSARLLYGTPAHGGRCSVAL